MYAVRVTGATAAATDAGDDGPQQGRQLGGCTAKGGRTCLSIQNILVGVEIYIYIYIYTYST